MTAERYDMRDRGPGGFGMRDQRADMINNVARDQFTYYVQQRDSLLRDIAASRTKGRRLIIVGAILLVVGYGTFAATTMSFISAIADSMGSSAMPSADLFGAKVGGFPIGIAGWAVGAIGGILLLVGIVLHIVAASRRRSVQRDMPIFAPGFPGGGFR
ncbi:hypothetical protein GCM10009836_13570 [Pseudonocardia ailaonensis]|uniref:DUF1206 domain-containing protein n=1 Tax=Pseudonocardia ailaonensis TaxID=367279 RepID=A0ABN2MSC2_9PSEU